MHGKYPSVCTQVRETIEESPRPLRAIIRAIPIYVETDVFPQKYIDGSEHVPESNCILAYRVRIVSRRHPLGHRHEAPDINSDDTCAIGVRQFSRSCPQSHSVSQLQCARGVTCLGTVEFLDTSFEAPIYSHPWNHVPRHG